jgi:uncharacterized protein
MLRAGEAVFVDTGAWAALAAEQDALHTRAVLAWNDLAASGARLHSSIPVVLETFTFLERRIHRDIANRWRESLEEVPRFTIDECTRDDLAQSWAYLRRTDLHRLSAVDATSFVIMKRLGIRAAFSFDHHFASVGFRLIG